MPWFPVFSASLHFAKMSPQAADLESNLWTPVLVKVACQPPWTTSITRRWGLCLTMADISEPSVTFSSTIRNQKWTSHLTIKMAAEWQTANTFKLIQLAVQVQPNFYSNNKCRYRVIWGPTMIHNCSKLHQQQVLIPRSPRKRKWPSATDWPCWWRKGKWMAKLLIHRLLWCPLRTLTASKALLDSKVVISEG